ncbi:ABC transporter substrate-binding protein [Mesorhizobium sp.]|uniref:ABC transporter substrate-binding protein n=1 Tax=Mesorhizobium sp. TaxID=1871066 RepID=UPI000FE559C2|nr:ABC transporter substrate-binding protein [Mesorhizobium sp.]RWM24729.1 MAG: twin-arginine translocation pathway signal protein [Mesorhizobium sp.]
MFNLRKCWTGAAGIGLVLAAAATSPVGAAEKAKVTLNWLPNNGAIGIIYAEALGFYKDAGIELEIEPGKGSGVTSQLVAGGSTDVGLAAASSAIGIAAKGAPLKIIAPIQQAGDWGVTSLKDTPISSPKDLEGKSIALQPGSAELPLFDAMVRVNGVDRSKIDIQMFSGASAMSLLAEKKVDAIGGAPADALIPLAERGIEAKQMFFKDWGAAIPGLSLIAREDKLQANPEFYKKFIDATLKGYAAAAKDPEAAIDALRERYPDAEAKASLLEDLTKFSAPSWCMPGSPGMGKLPADAWAKAGEILTATFGPLGKGGIEAMYTEAYLPSELPPCP